MATDRPKRANAGRNISKLLEQEEMKDEFYSTAYGGFQDISEDEEYQSEDEVEDVVDSDFDMSEKEEEKEEEDESLLQPKKKKRKWVKYNQKTSVTMPRPKASTSGPRKKKPEPTQTDQSYEPRNLRQSTKDLGQLALEREKLREEQLKIKRKYNRRSSKKVPKLTQEQLLQEAKKTEVENLASLEAYARMEAQKKTYKIKDHTINGPAIRYHSVTMPAVEREGVIMTEKYSRNFLIFTDTNTIPSSIFPTERPSKPKHLYCKVTGLPAKYVDPLTKLPYSTAQAFKVIRDRFVKEKEEKCDERLQQLSGWLEEKKRLKVKQAR